jgi:hypothetical protein
MLLATAQTAGQLAVEITAVNAQIAALDVLIANNAVITGGSFSAIDGTTGALYSQNIQPLTIAETSTILTSIISVLNTRLTAWNATLTGL